MLKSAEKSSAVILPSRVAPARKRMRAGCRFVVDTIDSVREYTIRTGRAQFPRRQRDKRLHREIELRSKSSAHRRRNNSNLLGRNPQNLRDIRAIHVRRLRARLNLDRIPDASRESRLGLDVGVLHKSSFVHALDHNLCLCQRLVHIPADHAPADQNVVVALRMN